MSDEMKNPRCQEEPCTCEHCELIRKIGYATSGDFAEEFLKPVVTTIADMVTAQQKLVSGKRVAGVITPDDEAKLKDMIYSGMINQCMHLAAKIAHINDNSLGNFVGSAAEHYDLTRAPMPPLIPIPGGMVKDLLEVLMGGSAPDPFSPPKGQGGSN